MILGKIIEKVIFCIEVRNVIGVHVSCAPERPKTNDVAMENVKNSWSEINMPLLTGLAHVHFIFLCNNPIDQLRLKI